MEHQAVFVHGLGQSAASWEPVVEHVTGAVAYDVRGFGQAPLGEADGTLAQLGQDLIEVMEATQARTAVGFSLGGMIVLWAAAHRPELFEKIVVLGTSSVVGSRAAEYYRQRAELVDHPEEFFEMLAQDTRDMVYQDTVDVDELTAQRVEDIGQGAGFANAARAVASVGSSLHDDLGKITAEIHVISGANDQLCSPKATEILLEALPQAEHTVIEQAGHLMLIDQPEATLQALDVALGYASAR
ncbi:MULTISPECIES: alpha/beta fold hydrolase [Auritidibacter]|uniref:alpha/beta fold hydrolase n=1 Tax=Auritidibacter TaxID=1160973 RepID=UPI000D72D169|nr:MULTISPECIES: alpha/beta hydrolase [Auritidibacter]PXA79221.1 alpha/beta hydrolase [Auritidibacter sp. NML120636]WGH90407.1 alpha/beta hydrolase [Auritidibacter ignavus]